MSTKTSSHNMAADGYVRLLQLAKAAVKVSKENIHRGILGFSGKVIRPWNGFYLHRTTQHREKRTYMYWTSLRPWGHCDGLHFRNSRSRFLWLVLSGSLLRCSYTKPWKSARLPLQLLILRLLFMLSIFIYPVAGERQRYSCPCSLINSAPRDEGVWGSEGRAPLSWPRH